MTPERIGEPYADADGTAYASMFRQPVVILEGDASVVRAAHRRAVDRGLTVPVFTADLFATGGDEENRAAVAAVPREELDLVGIAVHAPRTPRTRSSKERGCTPEGRWRYAGEPEPPGAPRTRVVPVGEGTRLVAEVATAA